LHDCTLTLSGDRLGLDFYVSRGFSLVTSSFVLTILLVQTTRLYAHVVNSNVLLRRERSNKLMNLEAISIAIAHEVRQLVTAIIMNSEAALNSLDRSACNSAAVQEARSALTDIIDDGRRTSEAQ
jgi:signal transduction histidine kinase